MDNNKITVSIEEVNSSQVDAELHRQDVANRMAEHQQTVMNNARTRNENTLVAKPKNDIQNMIIWGGVFSFIGWLVGEIFFSVSKHAGTEGEAILAYWLWYMALASIVSLGLSIAESVSIKNVPAAIKNGIIGWILGIIGGALALFVVEPVYHMLGGGTSSSWIQQIFARSIAWSFLGAFVAIAPGITMKSAKKFWLGLAGGAIGGLVGGILFDIIGGITGSGSLARLVNIVGLGVGAAIATVWLENVAKQGWLKVAAGLIAGKQFILYRNPTIIGSSPKCEIYLFKDPQVSPKHAAINIHNGDYLITAIEGASVQVNNQAIRQQKLKSGDHIQIGRTTFIFEAKEIKKSAN